MTNKDSFSASSISLENFSDQVEETLRNFLDLRRPELNRIGEPVSQAGEYLNTFVLNGGKRLRPLFTWAGFVGGGGLDSDIDPTQALMVASSLEFIQACALIHDDILDASDTRRGKPTVHRQIEQYHRALGWQGKSSRFGEGAAILIGDLALVWAEDMFQQATIPADARERIRIPWRAMRTEVIGGQLLDITLEASGDESIELSEAVNRFKTAAYTIERPLHLGAALAGADDMLIAAFRGYGQDIGMAFQLRDDELGIFGDPSVTGKPAGDDLREGKRTVLLGLALKFMSHKDPQAAQTLRTLIARASSPEDIAEMSQIIANSGAREEIEDRIEKLTKSGLNYLHQAHVTQDVADMLEHLAIKATARKM